MNIGSDPAFPDNNGDDYPSPEKIRHGLANGTYRGYRSGLTKRELFAAMAMQGILSDSEYNEPVERLASSSVRAADALIAELSKQAE